MMKLYFVEQFVARKSEGLKTILYPDFDTVACFNNIGEALRYTAKLRSSVELGIKNGVRSPSNLDPDAEGGLSWKIIIRIMKD